MDRVPVGAMVVTVALRWRLHPLEGVQRFPEGGKGAALFGQLDGSGPAFFLHKAHHVLGQVQSFLTVVGHAQLEEHVRPSHDAQTDLAVGTHTAR